MAQDPMLDPALQHVLEPGQLSAARQRPLPRRTLGRMTVVLLFAMRVYVVVALPIVAYAFIHALNAPKP